MEGDAAPVRRKWFTVSGQFSWYFPDRFRGGVGATDATTCLWKTRRTDNTESSVFSRDDLGFTGGEALTEPVTRLRRLFHRWNPDQRGNTTLSTQHIPLSADAKREQGLPCQESQTPRAPCIYCRSHARGREMSRRGKTDRTAAGNQAFKDELDYI